MKRLVVATSNEGKVVEIRAALPDDVQVETLKDHPSIAMPEETGETFAANASLKAEHVAKVLGVPALADDSGLVVDALDGAPGVRSARYAPGTDRDRYLHLLRNLEGVQERAARFVCAIAFAIPGAPTHVEEGKCEGTIGGEPVGDGGFGYDPVFVVDDGRTMAQLSVAEKNARSHRGRALAKMRPHLEGHFSLD